MMVHFYNDRGDGYHAYQEKDGTGFVTIHYYPTSHEHWKPVGFFDKKPTSAWLVDDWLKDENGKFWNRTWYGVMDDFGDLVEIEIEELP